MKSKYLAPLLTLSASCLLVGAHGNLVVNGDFNSDIDGWTPLNIADTAGYDPLKGNPGGTFLLASDILANPSISQEINGLIVGRDYSISGDYNLEFGPTDGGLGLIVTVNKIPIFPVTAKNYNWNSFNFNYTAPESSFLLGIVVNHNYAYRIDNISVAVTPEPNSLAIAGIGGLLIWLLGKKKA